MTITSQPEEDNVFIEPEVLTYPSKKTSSHGLNSVPVEIKVENIEDCEPDMTITSQPEEDNVFIEPEVLTYPSKKTSSHGLNSVPVIMESVIGTEKKSSSRKTCAMTGCEVNQARSPGVHFFKFPVSRQEICEQWVASCGNEALGSLTKAALRAKLVCEKHFTNDSFTSTLKTRLKINAIPTTVETCSSPTTPLLEEVTSLPQSLKETPFTPPVCRTESKNQEFSSRPMHSTVQNV
ncbi:uncharacterized protein LOC124367567 [Homalodisca vitripennis]|uniref:uncharacterized protein LOC124367567 n=1 Tax=Homalodisca vitripennis TaxID=197043 RepID=UPI001EEB1CE4|nr:uncharacterized protein LOC124367567 [Homalodisca vitripennis]